MIAAVAHPGIAKAAYKVERSTPAIGAEITGLGFAEVARNADLAAEVRALWLERRVLFFRQERIAAPELQATTTRRAFFSRLTTSA